MHPLAEGSECQEQSHPVLGHKIDSRRNWPLSWELWQHLLWVWQVTTASPPSLLPKLFFPDGWSNERSEIISENRWMYKIQVLFKQKMFIKNKKLQRGKNLQAVILGAPNGYIPRKKKEKKTSPCGAILRACVRFWNAGTVVSGWPGIFQGIFFLWLNWPPIWQAKSMPAKKGRFWGVRSPWKY